MTKRNPKCTKFIRNFNAKRVVSSWKRHDYGYNEVIMPDRENTEYFCYQTGQAKAMADEYQRKLDEKNWRKILDLLKNA
tara:strand:+ start:256 stop:492 length:237 start_codon:yes stop_codon:yes gene_type:complete